jgi:hypothetical protein
MRMHWITTLLFCNLCSAVLCIILAKKKRRSGLAWFLLSLPLGVLALFLLLGLPDNLPSAALPSADDPSG